MGEATNLLTLAASPIATTAMDPELERIPILSYHERIKVLSD
jgi:hypothetical protein